MEPTKFNELVEELLEPKLKNHIRNRISFPSAPKPAFYHEDSVALRPKARACGDCGDVVIGRVIFIEKRGLGSKHERWIKKCSECGQKTSLPNGLKDV